MNSTGWAVVVIVLVLIAGGAWWFTQQPVTTGPGTQATTTGTLTGTVVESNTNTTVGTPAAKTVMVSYTTTGFSPQNVTINSGDTVTFVNNSGGRPMWVAGDEHPTHTEYDSTSRATHCAAGYSGPTPFDQCGTGDSYSFTFNKAGSFNFHNHSAAQFGGTVTVQ